jgi:glutathione-regulated potassium-efflux system ancillary protein KefC
LVAAVIGSAVIPTVIANAFYLPRHLIPKPEAEPTAGPVKAGRLAAEPAVTRAGD